MPLVKVLRKRGANIVVTANAEILFTRTGDVGRWANRFSQKIRAFAAEEAPTNKRPRWSHYGKPLKSTMRASINYDPARMRVDAAVGSVSPHAYYVDQGTGVYAGRGPYAAKILPPWTRGGPSLYESTWRPGTETSSRGVRLKDPIGPVMIKGQKGQGFLDAGVRRGFTAMRLIESATGTPGMTEALSSFPTGLEGFAGNTEADGAFVAQLQQWREWRDAAWNRGDLLGNKPGRRRPEKDKRRNQRAARRAAENAAVTAEVAAKMAAARTARAAKAAEAERQKNLAKFRAANAAAKARADRAKADAKARQERADAARKRKEEREREARDADRLARGNRKMKREATEFFKRIREAYPDATLRSATLADGTIVYRVTYTSGGETVRQQWAYGYDT